MRMPNIPPRPPIARLRPRLGVNDTHYVRLMWEYGLGDVEIARTLGAPLRDVQLALGDLLPPWVDVA